MVRQNITQGASANLVTFNKNYGTIFYIIMDKGYSTVTRYQLGFIGYSIGSNNENISSAYSILGDNSFCTITITMNEDYSFTLTVTNNMNRTMYAHYYLLNLLA